MAFSVDQSSGDLVISGFEKGIGDSPYSGLTDLKNVNFSSIPGEASVAFSTSSLTTASQYTSTTVAPAGSNAVTFTVVGGKFLENGQAILVGTSSITGFTAATLFWVVGAQDQGGGVELFQITSAYQGGGVQVLGGSGSATFSTVNMVLGPRGPLNKNYMQESLAQLANNGVQALSHWLADSNGRVWTDLAKTTGGSNFSATSSWTYTGNTVDSTSFGNGLVYYSTINSSGEKDGWLFLFRSGQIDYLPVITAGNAIAASSLAWVYGWDPGYVIANKGTSGNTLYLGSCNSAVGGIPATTAVQHEAIVTPDSRVCYCDAFLIGRFYQNPPVSSASNIAGTWTTFNPLNSATYVFNTYPILPIDDVAQCMSYLGSNLLIGGRKNVLYPWDLNSTQYSNPLVLLPESFVTSIVTVRQNAYVFAGNRGRIYVTNGSQADLWAKVPDHISGTVQPNLQWGGAAFNLDKLYFGVCQSTTGAGQMTISSTNAYGGVWAVDVNTKAVYLSNLLSDAVYTGYCPVVFPFTISDGFTGYRFFAGWYDSATSSGLDQTVDAPYTGGQSVIISDMIPIGTTIQPTTPSQFEFKLSAPLGSTESVQLLTASSLASATNPTFTPVGTSVDNGTVSGSSTATIISGIFSSAIQEQQWLLVKAVLTSRNASPSLVRLTEIRVKGATVNKPMMSGFETQ